MGQENNRSVTMQVGQITFNPRIDYAVSIIKEELIDGKMWEEECHKKDYQIDEMADEIADLKEENERLSELLEELLCSSKNSTKKSKKSATK